MRNMVYNAFITALLQRYESRNLGATCVNAVTDTGTRQDLTAIFEKGSHGSDS